MISLKHARRIFLRVGAVAAGCDQAPRQISTERQQFLTFHLAEWRRLPRFDCSDVVLDPLHGTQGTAYVPAALKLSRDEAVRWVNGVILPAGVGNLILSLLQREFELTFNHRRPMGLLLTFCLHRRLGRQRG
jgi:hypothetical protein